MKNLFKFGFLALAISLSVAACSSEKTADTTDSTMTDSTMTDTSMSKMDTMMTDSTMADTTKM
ncbi:MAG: hypothetical protein H7223_06670 [Pedobacter sp.]|uniref:hypothetical protein n=1 Tax=Pedobacter sp. JCM 36344 TaxID=3374280 RepID=UPI00198FBDA7|nr:hypothetical protein [Pedobacter sp.]